MNMLPPSPLAESVQHISAVHRKRKKEKMTGDAKKSFPALIILAYLM